MANKSGHLTKILSSLFLRWPYKTAERVSFEVHKYFEENLIRSELTIYHLEDVLYQQNYVGEYQYKGFAENTNS